MYRICVLLVLQALLVLVPQTQAADEMRLLVAHDVRLTLEIPADWQPQRFAGYGSEEGFLSTFALATDDESITDACVAARKASGIFGLTPETAETTVDGQPACKVIPSDHVSYTLSNQSGIGLVIQHPIPFDSFGQTVKFVIVVIDTGHFDSISQTISFDPEKVTAIGYLTSVLDYIQVTSYYSDKLDWDELRTSMLGRLSDESSLNGIPNMIREIVIKLQRLGDRHSHYWTAPQIQSFLIGTPTSEELTTLLPNGRRLNNGIGYVELLTNAGIGGLGAMKQYVVAVYQAIQKIDATPTACWIVDLREDSGGNSDVMIASLAPLLGDGAVSGFVTADGEQYHLTIMDTKLTMNGYPTSSLYIQPVYPVRYRKPPIAVLISSHTGSAGEQTLLSFIGRTNSRTFGTATAGLTVGNSSLLLYDGAGLSIASGAGTDLRGTAYTGRIQPDVFIESDATRYGTDDDPVIEAASEWLLSLPECSR